MICISIGNNIMRLFKHGVDWNKCAHTRTKRHIGLRSLQSIPSKRNSRLIHRIKVEPLQDVKKGKLYGKHNGETCGTEQKSTWCDAVGGHALAWHSKSKCAG